MLWDRDTLNVVPDVTSFASRTPEYNESQLITTLQDLGASFSQKTQIDVAILDFAKAFDGPIQTPGKTRALVDRKTFIWINN